jgi:4-carboxymuconolactone decarboxylase
MSDPTPRIAPLPLEEWDDDVRAALRQGSAVLAGNMQEALREGDYETLAELVPNSITTPLRHPRLSGYFLAYNALLTREGTLKPRWREVLILRTCWRTGFQYEWLWHVQLAPRSGIDRTDIDAIAGGSRAGVLTELECDLVAAADQLIERFRIDDPTWARLADQLDERQLIEVPYIVGTYTCLAMAFNSFGMVPDDVLKTVDAPEVFPAG